MDFSNAKIEAILAAVKPAPKPAVKPVAKKSAPEMVSLEVLRKLDTGIGRQSGSTAVLGKAIRMLIETDSPAKKATIAKVKAAKKATKKSGRKSKPVKKVSLDHQHIAETIIANKDDVTGILEGQTYSDRWGNEKPLTALYLGVAASASTGSALSARQMRTLDKAQALLSECGLVF